MTTDISPAALARQAQAEADVRRRHWPARVLAGEMRQDAADRDVAAWDTIAELMRTGEAGEGVHHFTVAQLAAIADEACRRRAALLPDTKDDQKAAEGDRLVRLYAIRDTLEEGDPTRCRPRTAA